MEALLKEIETWFAAKREHLTTFAKFDSRVEGWFKAELLVLFGRLVTSGMLGLERRLCVSEEKRLFVRPLRSGEKTAKLGFDMERRPCRAEPSQRSDCCPDIPCHKQGRVRVSLWACSTVSI